MNAQSVMELPRSGTWLNAAPSTLQDHAGRPLVLAFVNGASVWCMQRLAEVAQWQARNPGRLQLLVVQVPRFDFEREPQPALKLLRRHGISSPILLDAQWEAWRSFGIGAWPTLLLLDAQGQERERLVGAVGDLEHRVGLRRVARGLLERAALGAELVGDREAGGVVTRAVDAEARRQLGDLLVEARARGGHITECGIRCDVVLDTGHGAVTPLTVVDGASVLRN